MKFTKLFIIVFLIEIASCNDKVENENKIIEPQIKSFEIKNINKNNFEYTIKGSKAIENDKSIKADNVSIKFVNQSNVISGKSSSAEYYKITKDLILKKTDFYNKSFNFNSDTLYFNEDKGITNSGDVKINSDNIIIYGSNLRSDKSLKTFILKKSKVKIRY